MSKKFFVLALVIAALTVPAHAGDSVSPSDLYDDGAGYTRRAIVPVAGSAPGAYGAMFKTALTLRTEAFATGSTQIHRGRIWFRPMGQPPSDNDPSIAYHLASGERAHWDDVVAAMGGSGIGYLEIIPDAGSLEAVPFIQTRVYNETASGTYGDLVQWNRVSDVTKTSRTTLRVEHPTDPRLRLNVGFVVLNTGYTDVHVEVVRNGLQRQAKTVHLFPREARMGNPATLFELLRWEPGDELFLTFTSSGVIPFYTLTDNSTNDPAIVVQPAPSEQRSLDPRAN
ncbi:MAG TPA: hypothetical protein VF618_10335 [Thermoanaerobaculia bacterium]